MNVKYIVPFIDATRHAFHAFLGSRAEPGKPFLYSPNEMKHEYDVSGIIGLAGEVQGFVIMSFPEQGALAVTQRLTGMSKTTVDDDVTDAIGEVVNIVTGNAKKDLIDFRIVISLPSVVLGNNHRIAWQTKLPVIVVPFETDFGPIFLFVSMKEETA